MVLYVLTLVLIKLLMTMNKVKKVNIVFQKEHNVLKNINIMLQQKRDLNVLIVVNIIMIR